MLSLGALVCFALGAAAAVAGFRVPGLRGSLYQFVPVGAGLALKTAAIGLACAESQTHLFNSYSEMFGLLAWALAFSYVVALAASAARSLGALILPLVVALMISSLIFSQQGASLDVPTHRHLAIHILSAFLGYGLFLTACGASILYLEQARLLKRKLFGVLFQDLPSLERLERLEILCAWLGVGIFAVAIGTGVEMAVANNQPFWLQPKIQASAITWLIFGALLIGRAVRWLNGRAAAKFMLAGAALVLLTFALGHPFGRPAQSAAWEFPIPKYGFGPMRPIRPMGPIGGIGPISDFEFRAGGDAHPTIHDGGGA